MLMRGAAMALGAPILGAAFVAGATAGFGLGVAAVGAACLARRAMKQRSNWQESGPSEAEMSSMLSDPVAMPDEGEPMPGANPA